MQTNIGFDFGTHQTKICAELKDYNYCKYQFLDFRNTDGDTVYVIPSLIRVNNDGRLEYGYFDTINHSSGRIVRYFKQATFNYLDSGWQEEIKPVYFSVWYIAYLLFDIIDRFDPDTLVAGVPTDSTGLSGKKSIAVSLFASAFNLVEDVFDYDKERFMNQTIDELLELTTLIPYSYDIKKKYGLYVFPEAYACLKPLLANSRLKESNMSLMVDIGGGTTDISFFTIQEDKPKIYRFFSIPKGLNYLTDNSVKMENGVEKSKKIQLIPEKLSDFQGSIKKIYKNLMSQLKGEFMKYPNVRVEMLESGLRNRPVIFTGGGSTFMQLRKPYGHFNDVRLVSMDDWKLEYLDRFPNMSEYCPILSTAYGLSIGVTDDSISMCSLSSLFSGFKNYVPEDTEPVVRTSTSYKTDWMTKEYGVLNLGVGSVPVVSRRKERLNHSNTIAPTKKKETGYGDILTTEEMIRITNVSNLTPRQKVQYREFITSHRSFESIPKKDPSEITSILEVDAFIYKRMQCKSPINKKKINSISAKIKDPKLRDFFVKKCNDYNRRFKG